jgi:subtilase-type serine protease
MYTFSGADSARSSSLPSFHRARRTLLSFVSAAAIAIALPAVPAFAQEAGKYFMADGSKTDDLEKAATSWRDDKEFKGSWGAGGMKAEYAYALGITGKNLQTGERIKIGSMDSGYDDLHPDLSDATRFHAVLATENNPEKVTGKYIPGVNDSHGTKVAGTIAAARDGKGMQGVAFDAEFYSGNTYADDNLLFGAEPQPKFAKSSSAYIASTYDAIVAQGVRIISNSWGSMPGSESYATLPDLQAAFRQHDGKNTWIEGPIRAAIGKDGKEGVIINFSAGNLGYDNASMRGSLPWFHPELEGHWMTTTGFYMDDDQPTQIYNRCGIAKYWCVAAPTYVTSTAVGGGYGGFNGTSAAAPHASAALALIMQRYPYMTNEQALTVLFTTAQTMVEKELHVPTTGTRGETAVVKSAAGLPNGTTGWGLVDLQKAMNGPGQFLGNFAVNMGEGFSDTWSNNISDEAYAQREKEDRAEQAEWEKHKVAKGWENGLPSGASDADKAEYTYKSAREAAFLTRQYSGMLTKSGLGTLTLAGKNTYRGDTIVDGGKLAIAAGGSIISTTFVNYTGQFSVDGTAANATINQGGELRVNQTGITGDLTFNGGWGVVDGKSGNASVNGGSLIIGNAGIAGDLVLNGGRAAVYGTAGNATVNAGGGLGGKGGTVASLVANRDGLVSPAGPFHTQEQDDGLVKSWPPHGTEIGVLTVAGDATFNPGSRLNIGIMWDASGADLLKVDGAATLLGGIVAVRLENQVALLSQKTIEGFFLDKSYEILNAGKGVTGRFESVLPQYNYVTAELDYSATNKVTLGFGLTAAGQGEQDRLAKEGKDEQDRLTREEALRLLKERVKNLVLVDAKTPNQIAVGGAIKELELGNQLLNTVLFSAIGEVLPYDNLSGEAHATLTGVLARDASVIGNAAQNRIRAAFDGVTVKEQAVIASPLAYAPAQRAKTSAAFDAHPELVEGTPAPATTALWGEAYGGWAHAGGNSNAAGYSRNTGGFVTGLDGVVAETWRMGVLAGYGNTSLDSQASNASVDSYSIGLYGGTAWYNLRLSLGTALTQNEIDTDRTAVFGSLLNRHSASYDAKTVQVFGELGYAVKTAFADFEPFAAASYVQLKSGSFQESGEISNLTGLGGTSDLTTTTLGLRASREFAISQTISLDVHGMLGWSHAFGDVTPAAKLAFAGGQPFDVKGLPVARDVGIVEAGFDVGIGKATTVGLTYGGQFSDSASDNAVKADLTVKF